MFMSYLLLCLSSVDDDVFPLLIDYSWRSAAMGTLQRLLFDEFHPDQYGAYMPHIPIVVICTIAN